jgi:hypothetical protein
MKKQIYDALTQLLVKKLEKHKNSKFDTASCILIYNDIFECVTEVFQGANIQISNEAMNMVCQMYYDAITINENHELDPNIFSQKANSKNIETKELALLGTLFSGTPFAAPFILEIKKRS